uniref:Uncharacterized protein n=1 Tax=Cucumis melo TaxID=3656 RepID=A0A9I9EL72_CUCME
MNKIQQQQCYLPNMLHPHRLARQRCMCSIHPKSRQGKKSARATPIDKSASGAAMTTPSGKSVLANKGKS